MLECLCLLYSYSITIITFDWLRYARFKKNNTVRYPLLIHLLLALLCIPQDVEDPRTEALREYCYGLMLPIICALGIIGNVLNLIVLTRRNMRGTAYIYMRGKCRPS